MDRRLQEMVGRAAGLVARLPEGERAKAEIAAGVGRLAETAVADPQAALVRVRKTLQFVVEQTYQRRFDEPAGTRPLENLVQRLSKEGNFPKLLEASADHVRKLGNVGAHHFGEAVETRHVADALANLLPILEWYVAEVGLPIAAGKGTAAAGIAIAPTSASIPGQTAARPTLTRRAKTLVAAFLAVVAVAGYAWHSRTESNIFRNRLDSSAPAVSLPNWADELPAAASLQMVYAGDPPAGTGTTSLNLQLERRTEEHEHQWRRLNDGDALSSADTYRVRTRASRDGWLYVFQLDSHGSLTVLYPGLPGAKYAGGTNPIATGQVVVIPETARGSSSGLFLDENEGIEHVYFVLTASRWLRLEDQLVNDEAGNKGAPRPAKKVAKPLLLATRGVGGIRPPAESAEPIGAATQLTGTEYGGGSLLVVERWFKHVAARAKNP